MSIETLISILRTAEFDVYLNEAPDNTACPYLVLTNIEHPNFGADNKVYVRTTELLIRLVEANVHDYELIASLEKLLDDNNIFYSEDDVSVPSEHVCETHFSITFYGGNTNA